MQNIPCLQTNLWDKYDILTSRFRSSGDSTIECTLFIFLYQMALSHLNIFLKYSMQQYTKQSGAENGIMGTQ